MALRLRIVSAHRRALGSRSAVILGPSGGNIGRAADNDLVLPDRSLFVSGHHARISFREDRYLLEDTSTNGTFLSMQGRQEIALRKHEILLEGSGLMCFGSSLSDPAADRVEFEHL